MCKYGIVLRGRSVCDTLFEGVTNRFELCCSVGPPCVVDDISVDAKYNGADDDWWQEEGFKLGARITARFVTPSLRVSQTERPRSTIPYLYTR